MNTDNEGAPVWMIVSAPSGAGKTTLCNRLIAEYPRVHYSVSCTTRLPRRGEQNGTHYHFMDMSGFDARKERDEFLECAEVHGSWYGTLKQTVLEHLRAGRDVLMDIDVQGAEKVREYLRRPDCDPLLIGSYVDVFVAPPSMDILRSRLISRNSDAPEVIERRLAKAQAEMAHRNDYQYLVVNDALDLCYIRFKSIYVAAHYRTGIAANRMVSDSCS